MYSAAAQSDGRIRKKIPPLHLQPKIIHTYSLSLLYTTTFFFEQQNRRGHYRWLRGDHQAKEKKEWAIASGGETKVLQTGEREMVQRDVSRVFLFLKSSSSCFLPPLFPTHISCNFNRNLHFHKTSSTSRKKKKGGIEKKENENELDGPSRSSGRPLNSENFLILYPLTPYYFVSQLVSCFLF